jgi:hypothetical protein
MKPVSIVYKYSGVGHARAQTTVTVNIEAPTESAALLALKKLYPKRTDIVIVSLKPVGK